MLGIIHPAYPKMKPQWDHSLREAFKNKIRKLPACPKKKPQLDQCLREAFKSKIMRLRQPGQWLATSKMNKQKMISIQRLHEDTTGHPEQRAGS